MTFECLRCGNNFKLKTDLKRHLKRKKACIAKFNDFSQKKCLEYINTYSIILW